MATVSSQYYNQQNGQDQQQGQNPSQPVSISGASAPSQAPGPSSSVSAGGGTLQNSANPTGSSSGRFTNLSNYLKANSGYNQQGGGFAGQINNNLQSQQGNIGNDINSAQNNFKTQSQTGRVQYNPNDASGSVGANNASMVNNAVNNAATFVQDPNQLNQFETLRTGQYSGPTTLQNQQQLQGQVGDYQRLTQMANNEGGMPGQAGRYELLNSLYGRPGYTQGQQMLDNTLLSSDPSQLSALQNAQNYGTQLNNQIQNTNNTIQGQVQHYQQEAQNTNQAVNSALSGAQQVAQTDIEKRKADAQAERNQATDAFRNALANGEMSPDQIKQFGLDQGMQLYGLNLGNYLTQGRAVDKSDIANAQDYAKFDALAKLAQGNNTYLPDSMKNALTPLGQAYGFNTAGFQRDLEQAKNAVPQQAEQDIQGKVLNGNYGPGQVNMSGSDLEKLVSQGVGGTLSGTTIYNKSQLDALNNILNQARTQDMNSLTGRTLRTG